MNTTIKPKCQNQQNVLKMTMKHTMQQLIAHKNLSPAESYTLFDTLDQAPIEQQAAVLALLAGKTITVSELLWRTTRFAPA